MYEVTVIRYDGSSDYIDSFEYKSEALDLKEELEHYKDVKSVEIKYENIDDHINKVLSSAPTY